MKRSLILVLLYVIAGSTSVHANGNLSRAAFDSNVSSTGSGFRIDPLVPSYSDATLRVTGPQGEIFRGSFESGNNIIFNANAPLINGQYSWELSIWEHPAASVAPGAPPEQYAREEPRWMSSGAVTFNGGSFSVEPDSQSERESAGTGSGIPPAIGSATQSVGDSGGDLPGTNATNHNVGTFSASGNACVGDPLCSAAYQPIDDLEVLDGGGNARILFRNSTGAAPSVFWDVGTTSSSFVFEDEVASGTPDILTLEEGAPDHAIFVDSTGAIGFGTDAPVQELHISGSASPHIRLDNGANTWDLASNSGFMWFSNNGGFPFVVDNDAPNESLWINELGRVGLGTQLPQGNLHIFGAASNDTFSGVGTDLVNGPALNFGYSGNSFGVGSGFFNVRPAAAAVAPNPALYFATSNVERMIIDNAGDIGIDMDNAFGNTFNPVHPLQSQQSGAHLSAAGVWTNASSRTLKENIAPLALKTALAALAALKPVEFNYKRQPDDPQVGFIAEDVPDLVATPDRKTLAPTDMVGVLTRVVQEQQRLVQEQQRRLDEQSRLMQTLLEEVQQLKQ